MEPGPGRLIQSRPLFAAAALATLVHLVMLSYETAVLGEWFRGLASGNAAPAANRDDIAKLIFIHVTINVAAGMLYAALARPPYMRTDLMMAGGLAAMLPNTICTFTGAARVIQSTPDWIAMFSGLVSRASGSPASTSVWIWVAIASLSLITGLVAAPLGIGGSGVVALIRERLAPAAP